MRKEPIAIGPEANRLIVGFRATPSNTLAKTVTFARRARSVTVIAGADAARPTCKASCSAWASRSRARGQITPSMHVLFLPKTLYGADVVNALATLRADPAVQFATVDGRRYALQTMPNDPLFLPTAGRRKRPVVLEYARHLIDHVWRARRPGSLGDRRGRCLDHHHRAAPAS